MIEKKYVNLKQMKIKWLRLYYFHLCQDMLPCLLSYCQKQVSQDPSIMPDVLLFISELLLHKVPPQTGVADLHGNTIYMLDFTSVGVRYNHDQVFSHFVNI